jgi:hypothetical protein
VPLPDRALTLPREPADAGRVAALAAEHGLGGPIERLCTALGFQAG